jgi:hypothetical protein
MIKGWLNDEIEENTKSIKIFFILSIIGNKNRNILNHIYQIRMMDHQNHLAH